VKVPLLATTILLVFVGFTHGTGTGNVTTTTIQTLNGQIFKITGAFTVTITQIGLGQNDIAATTSCTWGAPSGACYMNHQFVGNWTLFMNLQLNAGFVPATATNYLFSVIGNLAASSMLFSVPPAPTTSAPSTMLIILDLGTQTLPSTTVIQITVSAV
jgi:hypothetical protein